MSEYENALLQDFESDEDIDVEEGGDEQWSHEEVGASAGSFFPETGHLSNPQHPNIPSNKGDSNRNTLNEAQLNYHEISGSKGEKTDVFADSCPENPQNTLSAIQMLLQKRNSALNVGTRLQRIDSMKPVPVESLSSVLGLIPEIRRELSRATENTDYHELLAQMAQSNESEEYRFLQSLSALPAIVQEEIGLLYRYVCVQYKIVFPELETLVPSSEAYCAVVLEVGQDLADIRAHETNLKRHVTPEKVLTIVMAALQQHARSFTLSEDDMKSVAAACAACMELHGFLREIGHYIAGKLASFAPNVTALVGPITSSQLLMSSGSLATLAQTPACNLPSLGARELSIQHSGSSGKNTGYLFHSPILQGLPPEILRSAQRVLSAKTVLAARMDLARSCTDGSMGQQYQQQVQDQIDRLLTPPERVKTKALPVPQEQKSKKRAGRRFRKVRERFQMSELRKAQNKVQFGKEEDHVVDGYGEEVGLGMSRQSDSVQVNRNTDARMSKAMISRLQSQKERDTLDSLADTIVLAPAEKRKVEESSEWGSMKKRKV